MAEQWLRKCTLTLQDSNQVIDLSNMRIVFRVASIASPTPATLSARIYNLSPGTANALKNMPVVPQRFVAAGEPVDSAAAAVTLAAGYEGNFGVIFQGQLLQAIDGRDSAVDSYLEVVAADGEYAHSWGVINTSISSGWTDNDAAKAIADVYKAAGVTTQQLGLPAAVAAPRGKVMVGMVREHVHTFSRGRRGFAYVRNNELRWMLPQTAYNPGDIVRESLNKSPSTRSRTDL